MAACDGYSGRPEGILNHLRRPKKDGRFLTFVFCVLHVFVWYAKQAIKEKKKKNPR